MDPSEDASFVAHHSNNINNIEESTGTYTLYFRPNKMIRKGLLEFIKQIEDLQKNNEDTTEVKTKLNIFLKEVTLKDYESVFSCRVNAEFNDDGQYKLNIKEERYSRNPKLAAALTQYKWVRESNEGVGRIFDEMKDYFLDDPVYSEPNNSSVQLTLKNNIVARKERETGRVSNIITPELFDSLNEQQELIVRHLYNQGELTASKIAAIIQRSVPTARKRLKELEEMNVISTHGSSKNDPKRTYYLLD